MTKHLIAADLGVYDGPEPGFVRAADWLAWRARVSPDWVRREVDDGIEALGASLSKHAAFDAYCDGR